MPEFQYNEQRGCPDCLDYMEKLSTENNPFECKYARVLPEKMTIRRYSNGENPHLEGKPQIYEEGILLCMRRVELKISRKCGNLSKPQMKEGKLVWKCNWTDGGEVILNLRKQSIFKP